MEQMNIRVLWVVSGCMWIIAYRGLGDAPNPDLPVEEDTAHCLSVETVHRSNRAVAADFGFEDGALGVGEPLGCLGPVGHEEICDEGATSRHAAFDDEDPAIVRGGVVSSALVTGNSPAPALVAIRGVDVSDGESEKAAEGA
jgi:hypothetical protein